MVGLIGLDGVDDPGLAEGFLQQILLLVGERLVLNRPRHVHGGLDGARLVVGAVRVVGLGEVPTVEGGCRSDAITQVRSGDEREPAAHAVAGGADAARPLLGQGFKVVDEGASVAHHQVYGVAPHHAHDLLRGLLGGERGAHVDRVVGAVAVVEIGHQDHIAQIR